MKNANPVSWQGRWFAALVVALVLSGCGQAAPTADPTPKTVADAFPVKLGAATVQLQLAVTGPEMQRGLMERTGLKSDHGMIFIYTRPQSLSFWMRNTPTPLDIGFFTADGELREIYPLHPFDETAVGSHRKDLQFAVEMNQGWFKANGVKPGDKLDLAAIVAALNARGFPPRAFGLAN